MIWEGDGHNSPNYTGRSNLYGVQALPTAVFGGYIPDVGGGTTYPRYVGHYNVVVAEESPLSIDLTFEPGIGGSFLLSAEVEVTGDITTTDNFLQYIITYNYSDTYFATVVQYEDDVFDLTNIGQTASYSHSFTIDNEDMDLTKLTAVFLVQTNEGTSTGGQYPITTREILQGAKAFLSPDAELTGTVRDLYTNNPIPGATVRVGSFETTTTFNGTYTLNTIAMTYDVEVSAPNYETAATTVTTVADETTTLDMSLTDMLLPPAIVNADVNGGTVSLTWPYPEIPTSDFRIEIFTDNYPTETTWDLVDGNGDLIATDEGVISNSATLYEWDLLLSDGSYTWTIYDTYGDGICCSYGNGYYNLILDGAEIATGGDFGDSESVTFEAQFAPMRELLGYNIWQDDGETPLNGETLVTELAYTIDGVPNGTYSFTVTAVYSAGESSPSYPAVVEVTESSTSVEYINLADWNMVGLPVLVLNPNYQHVFPNSVENTLFYFDEGYISATDMVMGTGYWLRFADAGSSTITGTQLQTVTVSLTEGWNLISGPSVTCDLSDIDDPNNLIIPETCYGFGNGYESVSALEPGFGYWIRSAGTGDVTFGGFTTSRISEQIDWLEKADVLTINGKNLYFGVDISDDEMLRYSLPPKPPLGAFDVRYQSDYKVTNSSENIEISGVDKNLIVSTRMRGDFDPYYRWVLTDLSGNEYNVSQDSDFTIPASTRQLRLEKRPAELPEAFALQQNYPNPFNPVTTIEYAVSDESNIRLAVFDILGKQVQTLVNEVHPPGNYQITFDGTSLSSGVYFYTLETSSTTLTKKLILLK